MELTLSLSGKHPVLRAVIILLFLACISSYGRHGTKIDMIAGDILKKTSNFAKKIAAASSIAFTSELAPISATKFPVAKASQGIFRRDRGSFQPAAKDERKTTSFVTEAVRKVGPSVVRIDCERAVPPIMAMFTDQYREGDVVRIAGSGVVVTKNGYILTNAHVVDKTRKVTVTMSNGRVYKASLISVDELQDLAVIKAELGGEELTPAPFGDSSKLQSGEWVIAVGCPVGLDFTVTLGIVSNPRRSAAEVGAPQMKGMFIQTDAALNHGNSGGPLVNQLGEVIGINTMVRSNTEAIGFAIPINSAISTYHILKEGNKPTHAFFGLEVTTVSPDWAKIYNDDPNGINLPEMHGALVMRVVPGSPAALSGLRKYDIIVEVDNKKIQNSEDAELNMDGCKPGVTVDVKVARGTTGAKVVLKITPQDLLTMMEEKKAQFQQPQQPKSSKPALP